MIRGLLVVVDYNQHSTRHSTANGGSSLDFGPHGGGKFIVVVIQCN